GPGETRRGFCCRSKNKTHGAASAYGHDHAYVWSIYCPVLHQLKKRPGGTMHVRVKLLKPLVLAASGAILAASGAFSSVATVAETIRWRVQSHWPTSSSSYKDSLERLQQVVKVRTDGRLQLDLYADGSLFKANETFNAVSRGIIQMGTISPVYGQDKLTLGGIASGLPFGFREVWEVAYFRRQLRFEEVIREEAAYHGVYYST